MNVETYLEAKELYDKYSLCESVLEYLSDADLPQGQKYLETLKMFVNVFPNDFMMFVHNKMQEIGAMFEELHCPEHSESGLQPPILPPTEDKEPKFPIGSKVEVIEGIGKGGIGVVKDYNPTEDRYYVVSDKFSMWFAESELEEYVEESEVPPITDTNGFSVGNRIEVISGDRSGEKGLVHDINEDGIYVYLDGEAWLAIYEPSEIKKIDPENPEDNGAGDTDPIEGE